MSEPAVDIIGLGGLGQFGMNCTVLRSGDEAVIIDAGMAFPAGETWGVDAIVPDLSELLDSGLRVLAIVLTHGHEDHIGALPTIMERTDCPIYGSDLTMGFARARLAERGLPGSDRLTVVCGRDRVSAGPFSVEFLIVTHSVPGSYALVIETPAGCIVHSADFKLDPTPISGPTTDLERLAARGREGVKILLLDSTNAARPGSTPSERRVGEALSRLIEKADRRVIVTTFSSHVHRAQQLVDAAVRARRRVAFVGRRMTSSLGIAREMGHLRVPADAVVGAQEAMNLRPDRCLILAGGSQGEPGSAMSRVARGEHPEMQVERGDVVVHSARPVPGNEVAVGRMLDGLARLGAVFPPADAEYHVSGHASADDLSVFLDAVRPETLVPVHGTYRHLLACAKHAESLPSPPRRILIAENGDIIRVDRSGTRLSGRISPRVLFVDRECHRLDETLLQERRMIGTEGLLLPILVMDRATGKLLAVPKVLSRGFVVSSDGEDLLGDAARAAAQAAAGEDVTRDGALEDRVKDEVKRLVRRRTGKRPFVSPIVVQL